MELSQYSTIPTYLILQNFEKQILPCEIQYYQKAFVWMVTPQDFIHMQTQDWVRTISITVQDSVNLSW